jgi:uncharacterized protein (DUF983 family)
MGNHTLHKLKTGFALRCPICEQGRLGMRQTCLYCQSRFERSPRDKIGGLYLSALAAQVTAVGGFLLVESLFHISPLLQLVFWIPYSIVFALLFYPRARGLSVALNALRGRVYPDFDCERQYIAQEQATFAPQELE